LATQVMPPAPTNLVSHASEIGATLSFDVVGLAMGPLWGTDLYTLDSYLAVAAVHAGRASIGSSARVTVTLEATPGVTFIGSFRNGVQSNNWPSYPVAYRFV
jgi:hypothetical protein